MSRQVSFDWSEGIEIDGEWYPEDKLNRKRYAEFLTRFLESEGYDETRGENAKRNYVLNLNSTWGSGKTYFLKRWAEELKDRVPVVYVDAWKKDYSDDPLMTVIAAIVKDLRAIAGKEEDSPISEIPAKLFGLLKAAAPGIGRGLTKRYLGIDLAELSQEVDDNGEPFNLKNEDGTVLKGDDGNPIDLSFAASEAVKHLIDEHEAKSEAIDSLKESVGEWVEAAKSLGGRKLPAFVFIDELDRCRPSYAVEMLETIKHIFDIPGVVFVVATDTEQLQHAVKAIYGEGFNAKVYLGRFFDSRFSLNDPKMSSLLEAHCGTHELSTDSVESLGIKILSNNPEKPEITLRNMSVLIDTFELPPRTAIQVAERVLATVRNMPYNAKVDILMLTTLMCLKERDNDLYEEAVSGSFERVNPRDGAKGRLTLDEYLEEILPEQKDTLTLALDVHKTFPKLDSARYGRPYNHHYLGEIYHFSVIEYLSQVFAKHFKSQLGNSYFGIMSSSSPSIPATSLQKAGDALLSYFNEHRHEQDKLPQSGILWIKYIYDFEGYDKVSPKQYQELVDLASALDWLGEDD